MFRLHSLARAAFAAVLVLALLGAASSAASAADRQVATTGTDDGDCVTSPCATLEYTQTQVQAGDTVQLADGVYPVGDATFDVNDVTYERSGPGEAKITVPGNSNGIQISGDDLMFRDLTVSSPDDTIQGETYAFTYHGSGLTLDHMLVEHVSQGVEFGHGITVTDSTFADIGGTAITLDDGLATATDNDFSGDGIHVTEQSTVTATGNVFRGNVAGHGGNGIYFDNGSAGGTVTGNRFSPSLEYAINRSVPLQAPNNWWGCNEGVDHDGCAANYDTSNEQASEPHLVLDVSGSPDPFLTTGDSTITARLTSSDPESTFTGGPIGTAVTLSTSEGTLDDPNPAFVAGVAQTTLRNSLAGFTTVTATLDNASVNTSLAQSITFTSDTPTDAAVGGSYTAAADGGGSTQPVTFTIDADSTDACAISGATVSFTGVGTCTVDADQAGDLRYAAAAQQQQSFEVAKAAQTITFTSDAPTDAAVGDTYDLTATGGASGNSVTFSVDDASDTDACTITDATVSSTGAGTCIVDADQAGDDSYADADRQQQSFDIAKAAQTITFTSIAPTTAIVGDTYDLTATGGASGNPVTFSVDEASDTDACTITDSTVSFTGLGSCVIDADQLGDDVHTAAAQAQQTITVSVASASLSPSSFAYDAVDAGAGATPQSKTFTLTNTGDRDITAQDPTLDGDDQADYVVDSITCATTLHPADQCTYVVTFAPVHVDATYDAAATLNVQYANADDDPATVTSDLSGHVDAAPFVFAAESDQVDLGSATVATATAPKHITFTNTGHRTVHPDFVSLLGQDSGAYALGADTCTDTDVAPAATCSVAVTFTPAAAGVAAATLRLAYGGGAGAVNVGLTGTGVAKQESTDGPHDTPVTPPAVAPAPVTPTPIAPTADAFKVERATDSNGNTVAPGAFKAQGPGTSTAQDIVVKNTGTADVQLGQVSVGGSASPRSVRATTADALAPFTIKSDRCSRTVLAAGATCVVQVTFSAKTAGTYKANLIVPSSQGNLTVPLAGSVTHAAAPLKLNTVRTPVVCLTYGAATPKKSIKLKTSAKATVSWAIKKARGSQALLNCLPTQHVVKHVPTSGTTKGSGTAKTTTTGSASVKLSTLLPTRVRKAMKPGLYRITFVARNATGVSPERVVLIRVLKPRR
jgi:hypothetical protein